MWMLDLFCNLGLAALGVALLYCGAVFLVRGGVALALKAFLELSDAKAEARSAADKMIADAKLQIAAEKESALTDVRREVALLGVQVAEKILRKELADDNKRAAFLDSMVDEVSRKTESLS